MRVAYIGDLEWLTPQQIASAMQVSVQTIYREIERGHLIATKVGKQKRVSRENYRRWTNERGE